MGLLRFAAANREKIVRNTTNVDPENGASEQGGWTYPGMAAATLGLMVVGGFGKNTAYKIGGNLGRAANRAMQEVNADEDDETPTTRKKK